jgi:hypothetical protein
LIKAAGPFQLVDRHACMWLMCAAIPGFPSDSANPSLAPLVSAETCYNDAAVSLLSICSPCMRPCMFHWFRRSALYFVGSGLQSYWTRTQTWLYFCAEPYSMHRCVQVLAFLICCFQML